MGGSSKGGGTPPISGPVEQGLLSNENALVNIAQQQNTNAQTLFGLTEPGLGTAESFYSKLASGDPSTIQSAIAPAVGQIQQGAQGATQSILNTAPAGGEKNLALEQVQANKGSQVGSVATQAYLGAPNALASLASQGVGESISSAGQGISGLSAGSTSLSNIGQLQVSEQQIQAQQKGSVLGALGSLAGAGAELGSAGTDSIFGALLGL
jgi:hypothetical protein